MKLSCLTYKTNACLLRLDEGIHMPEYTLLEITQESYRFLSCVDATLDAGTLRHIGRECKPIKIIAYNRKPYLRTHYAQTVELIIAIKFLRSIDAAM